VYVRINLQFIGTLTNPKLIFFFANFEFLFLFILFLFPLLVVLFLVRVMYKQNLYLKFNKPISDILNFKMFIDLLQLFISSFIER